MSATEKAWRAVLDTVTGAFTAPSFGLFCELMSAWALTTARRSIVSMVDVMDPSTRGAHDAYHRFVRAGSWSLTACFLALAKLVIALVPDPSCVTLYLDDTLFHRNGPKVEGAGSWRDAVRSTRKRVVFARGLNLVVLTVGLQPRWGGMTISIPVNLRLHRKGEPTMPALAAEMMAELAGWFPSTRFVLCADGAYATLAGNHLERTAVVSRMRRDAALYEAPPSRTNRRGRPRKKGARLGTPVQLARAATSWQEVELDWRGHEVTKLLWSRDVLWYRVCRDAMVRLVVVRDPTGHEPDDFFFTTDLQMSPGEVAEIYAGRWSIELCYREVKQGIGGQEPQSWKLKGPERAAGLAFWLYGAVWIWYLKISGERPCFAIKAWYPTKATPSFADALAELRRHLWRERITGDSGVLAVNEQTVDLLVEALAVAA